MNYFNTKNFIRIIVDGIFLAISLFLATYLRLFGSANTEISNFIIQKQFLPLLCFVIILKLSTFFISKMYDKLWRYTSTADIIELSRNIAICNFLLCIPRFLGYSPANGDLFAPSIGIVIIDFFLSSFALAALRLIRQHHVEQRNIRKRIKLFSSNIDNKKRTIIIGAGDAGRELITTVNKHPELGIDLIGYLDDDKKKQSIKLDGQYPILGPINEIAHWVDEKTIELIIIAMPSAPLKIKSQVSRLANATGIEVRTIPSLNQLTAGRVTVDSIKKLNMEDLLGRGEIDLDLPEISTYLKNKKVLVTGAGGSIGKEICRQLFNKCSISSICLLGRGENSIFETLAELNSLKDINSYTHLKNIEIITKIADIKNFSRLDSIFADYKPDVVFHAAAHKHVHLMEINSCEAFDNNVIGSQNVMDIAAKYKVANFVLISTDKAVNPTSIMGTTKKLAEKLLLKAAAKYPDTKFTAVRFGNVLGSRGSVITVWQKQIKSDKSITVTNKDAIRYFMTIPEASQLVIKAAAIANSGEIMVLDMGEPINIYELAQQFIKLSGLSLDDIDIKITGLKPGEKLYEELLTGKEFISSQITEKIYKANIEKICENNLENYLVQLTNRSKAEDTEGTKEILHKFNAYTESKASIGHELNI